MKVLITGFDPFGEETVNPAYEAVKLLPDEIAGAKIIKLEIPTVFNKCDVVLEEAIDKNSPDVVLSIGQAGGRFDISVERVAVNIADGRIPDNDGYQPIDKPIRKDGPNAYFASVPVKAMVDKIRGKGIPASVSYTAGSYVCNFIMYCVLHSVATKHKNIRAGFIHVPFMTSQGIGKPVNTPTMSIEAISSAIGAAIEAIVENKSDIGTAEGTIS